MHTTEWELPWRLGPALVLLVVQTPETDPD
jgi:hypothetical protein